VGHHRHVGHLESQALTGGHLQRRVLPEGCAVDRPHVRSHLPAELHRHRGVRLPCGQPCRLGRTQVDALQDRPGELGRPDRRRRSLTRSGAHQRERLPGLAERDGDQREHSLTEGDDGVVAFPHPDVDRAGLRRLHRVTVAVSDRQAVPAQGHGEDGVGRGVDDPQPHPLARLGPEGLRCGGHEAVDQEVRVSHIGGVAERRVAHVRVVHPAHPAVAGGVVAGGEFGEHLVRGASGAVQPVVQDHDPFGVVAARFGRVVDDQGCVQAAVELHSHVRVEEVGAGIGCDELVEIAGAGGDRRLGHPRHPVGRVVQSDPVPMDRGVRG